MSHAENKVKWCLKKAEKELQQSEKHRRLIKTNPNLETSSEHLEKADHYLKATEYLKKGNYSDISTSTIFYSIYHSLLAIAAKFGYESRNQECTFALIYSLIEQSKISMKKELLDKITSLETEKENDKTTIEIREQYQYGTELSLKEKPYERLFKLAQETLSNKKVIIEE